MFSKYVQFLSFVKRFGIFLYVQPFHIKPSTNIQIKSTHWVLQFKGFKMKHTHKLYLHLNQVKVTKVCFSISTQFQMAIRNFPNLFILWLVTKNVKYFQYPQYIFYN